MTSLLEQVAKLSIVSIDIEGDGGHPPRIVEISAVQVKSLKIRDQKTWLLNPGRPIGFYASKVHGIKDTDVINSPELSEIQASILDSINNRYMIAHNASVERIILNRFFPTWKPIGVIDTLKLSRTLNPQLKSHKLGGLVTHYDLDSKIRSVADSAPHRALYDAVAAFYLFLELLSEANAQGLTTEEFVVDLNSTEGAQTEQLSLF